jgi:hypothetical protein
MREEMQQIDTSPIEHLVEIKNEQGVLHSRIEKMEERKENVSAAVYQRVRRDYETRLVELEREARPLKEQARREYAKLRSIHSACEAKFEAARLDREELVFRHELEEIGDDEFQKRIREADVKVAEREAEIADILELKGRFIAAFPSEADLESAAPPTPAPEAKQEPAAAPEDEEGEATFVSSPPPDATTVLPQQPDPPATDATTIVPVAPAQSFATAPDATSIVPASALGSQPAGDATADATQLVSMAPEGDKATAPGATVILTVPKLVSLVDDKPGDEHSLKPDMTMIGRSVNAHIRIAQSSVSRQHAKVVLDKEGYKLIDLGSENGTLVNGKRVSEHLLLNGDVIQIGGQRLQFRV